jgi:flagellar protein FlaG
MAEIARESQPIESVTGVGSAGGRIGVLSLPERVSPPAGESRPSPLATLEVAMPDLGKILEGFASRSNIGLTYVVDPETHSVIVKVIDRDTNEIVREIPSEEMMRLRAAMRDLFGSLFKTEV